MVSLTQCKSQACLEWAVDCATDRMSLTILFEHCGRRFRPSWGGTFGVSGIPEAIPPPQTVPVGQAGPAKPAQSIEFSDWEARGSLVTTSNEQLGMVTLGYYRGEEDSRLAQALWGRTGITRGHDAGRD